MDRNTTLALETLETCGASLHALLLRLTLRHDVAEDLTQELFLRLARARTFADARDPRAYAARVAINLAMDWRRRRARDRQPIDVPVALTGPTASPLADVQAAEETEAIMDAVGKLPASLRDAVVMRCVQQESYESIAAHLGKDVHQVRSLVHKALSKLRSMLGGVPSVRAETRHGTE
ncbi:MAG: sigma-70 family RNA polymerase sigma factor [Planctomycetota bacterium]|nr:sigma-70 family RNA polymerase sigma factor [Planctomycetota bacterium]